MNNCENNKLDQYIGNYIISCKNNDRETINGILNSIHRNIDHRVIARNTCVSIDTINNIHKLHQMVGGDIMSKIADYTEDMYGAGKKKSSSGKSSSSSKSTLSSFDESINSFEETINSANKAIEGVNKAVGLAASTGAALAGIYNALMPGSKKEKEGKKTNVKELEEEVTSHPKTKNEVVTNLELLEGKLKEKNQIIEQTNQSLTKCVETLEQNKDKIVTDMPTKTPTKGDVEQITSLTQTVAKQEEELKLLRTKMQRAEELHQNELAKLNLEHKKKLLEAAQNITAKEKIKCEKEKLTYTNENITKMTGKLEAVLGELAKK
jgi:hypothetical protein